MRLFRHPLLKFLKDLLVVLLLVTLAARSEASCAPVVSDFIVQKGSIKNCADMDADLVGGKSSAPDHHKDGEQISRCHLGCTIMLSMAASSDAEPGYLSGTYVREREPRMIGISKVPQTPPPRFSGMQFNHVKSWSLI